ncbi:recombinase family protein [Streptomyces sp. NBC_00873]|uniref:recombinase family protein n=1 Tax=unclassified Streptomyces TaxID=2593676 RepID=UPI00386AFF86|nr:recombinase family protein [Streptomyces sp. NBC_00873]WTA45209.1 recombinase family protein [Streptomyces sp. NBC_00842]
MRAFIYDRHATFLTAILDIRLDRCRGYAESRGWEVAGIWLDLGDHALSDDHRPQFDAMCRDLEASAGPTVCLVDDFARLTRDASRNSVMRRRIAQAGSHCETSDGESDTAEHKQRGRLCTPH